MNNRTRLFTECVDLVGSACKPFDGTKKYVSTGAVDVDRIIDADTEIVDYDGKPSRANLEVVTGDILFAKMQGTKKTLLIDSVLADHIYSTGFCAVRAKEGILTKRCLYHLLTSEMFLSQKDKNCSGATQKAITNAGLDKIVIQVPSIDEQNDIADQLDAIKSILTKRHQELSAFDDLIKARFVEMFGDCRLNPKRWNTVALGDIAEVGSSKRVFVDELKEIGVPFYRGTEVGAFAEGKTVTPEVFITEEHYIELIKASGKPEPGDLLMPSICPDGRIWVVDTDKPFYFKDGRVLWVHGIDKRFDPVFLLYTLKDRIMSDYGSIASGTTFAELKIFALKRCQVFNVPLEKQRNFAAFIAQVDKSKAVAQKALDEAQLLFDSLMQKYFG